MDSGGAGSRPLGGRTVWAAALACALVIALGATGSGAVAGVPQSDRGAELPGPPSAAEVARLSERFQPSRFSPQRSVSRGGRAGGAGSGGVGEPVDPGPGGGKLFPEKLMVAVYGAPQLAATAVGKRSPKGAARLLRKQARPYKRHSKRRVLRSINLIGVIATASRGADGLYRTRQDDRIIRNYLEAARSVGARLTLDIQPGRAEILDELDALRKWIAEPDVDIGIDPEWAVGRKGVPGSDEGQVTHREINRASRWLQRRVTANKLPPKALIVHQFRRGSIKRRGKLRQRDGVHVTLNFDGIGNRRSKRAGYASLARPRLFDGFSLFYDRDSGLMNPRGVLRLEPEVEYVMYQ